MTTTAATETYHDVERLLDKIVWQFMSRFGGDFDELRADANTHFIRAYNAPTFDYRKSRFSTWVQNIVWRGLMSDRSRGHARRWANISTVADMDINPAPCRRDWTPATFAEDLSVDARAVLSLTLDAPAELTVSSRGNSTKRIRASIYRHLEGLGWAADRIAESFDEIRAALAE